MVELTLPSSPLAILCTKSRCRSDSVVPNARTEKGLVGDCEVLLGVRDTLAGTAARNVEYNDLDDLALSYCAPQ